MELSKRIARCEAICNQLRAEMADLLKIQYEDAAGQEDKELAATTAREYRNQLLADSDNEMVSDRPSNKTAWKKYRQALRDISKQAGFPFQIDWPEVPEDE